MLWYPTQRFKVLRVNVPGLKLESRVWEAEHALTKYLREHELARMVVPRRKWIPQHHNVAVGALVAGVAPREFKGLAIEEVHLQRLMDEPSRLFGMLAGLAPAQLAVEACDAKRREAVNMRD